MTVAAFATPAVASDILSPASFASSGVLDLTSGAYIIETNGGPGGAAVLETTGGTVLATGSSYAQGGSFDSEIGVLDFSSISISAGVTIRVTGAYPLALLSRGAATIGGTILANGANGTFGTNGGLAGAGGPGGGAGGGGGVWGGSYVGSPGQGPGGGPSTEAGLSIDSFGAGGAFGGEGTNGADFTSTPYGDLTTALQGGSGGSGGGSDFFDSRGGGGGGGGGAIEFVAATTIDLTGSEMIEANGGGGMPSGGLFDYVAGGGSGGGLIFAAPTIQMYGYDRVVAEGGFTGGGGGRMLFLTDAGQLFNASQMVTAADQLSVDVGGALYGYPGTVTLGLLSSGVPEPAAWAMLLGGLLTIGAVLRRPKLAVRAA
jgi:hypothetical protein